MAAVVKIKLKAARDAIAKRNWEAARDAALGVLDFESNNYNANVFLGLASLELGDHERSEQAYRAAISDSPEQALAWQGLSKFYERTEKWDGYKETLEKLMKLFSSAGDSVKCAEAVQRFVALQREHGTRSELASALALYLPGSPYYGTLSTLPPPDPTNPTASPTQVAQTAIHNSLDMLSEIVEIVEKEEESVIANEVKRRRERLGAPSPEKIRRDVDGEILANSSLPKWYDEIMGHPKASDELRRSTEAKLLNLRLRYLTALSEGDKKEKVAGEVEEMIDGIVLLGIPNEVAWTMAIEGKDTNKIEGYDYKLLQQFIGLFPQSPLSRLISGWFAYNDIPVDGEDDDANQKHTIDPEEALDEIMGAFEESSNLILPHRILGEIYTMDEDHENTIKIAESGLELVKRAEVSRGRKFPKVRKAFNVILATALVHHYPPKHHARAIRILDDVITQDSDNVTALLGRGFVLQYANRWKDALQLFEKVTTLRPGDLVDGIRAREEAAWCYIQTHEPDVAREELKALVEELDTLENRELDQARCWWRLGKCYWDLGDEYVNDAYKCFITALKRSPSFAPAFTSLGFHYAERADPPDPTRASKCFQKAFELDPRESSAAQRLAEGFAEEREWDLVDVVARRTIEGEGGLENGAEAAASARYLPTNAWAWKAVGSVEMHRRNYPQAIQAFQIALRADQDDQLSWLRLGEAYSKAGRYAASIKALDRAHELKPGDWMCTFLIGDVLRQTGQFQDAITYFDTILAERPAELGVLMALAQTYLDLGRSEIISGFAARSEASFLSSIRTALQTMEHNVGFRRLAWKIAADALFELGRFSSYKLEEEVRSILGSLIPPLSSQSSERTTGLLSFSESVNQSPLKGSIVLEAAVAAYDYRLSFGSLNESAHASAWADFAISLHVWTQQCLDADKKARGEAEAIRCITEALRADAGVDTYWNALGNMSFISHPKTAQHAYIKALEIDNKNVVTWTSLGFLYLHYEDHELANEAFFRAQTLDPDFTLAWVGQGLVATLNGHDSDARNLFEHAVSLAADLPAADLEFSTRLFWRSNTPDSKVEDLIPVFFALERYCRQREEDASALHLLALVCERLGHFELGITRVAQAISILEAAYEVSEDATIERHFIIANTTMGRLQLAMDVYPTALEAFQSALGLLPEEFSEDDHQGQRLKVQCQFGSGLSYFKLGQLGEALALFQGALTTAGDDTVMIGQITVLLSQALWALGSEDGRESAKNQLLQCITTDPGNLMAINTLAGMGILSEDDGLVDAALSEILALPLEQRRLLDPQKDVPYLLAQHQLGQRNLDGAVAVYQSAAFVEPSHVGLRTRLAELALQRGEPRAALALVEGVATEGAEDTRRLGVLRVAAAGMSGNTEMAKQKAQHVVMATPWDRRAWAALAYSRSVE